MPWSAPATRQDRENLATAAWEVIKKYTVFQTQKTRLSERHLLSMTHHNYGTLRLSKKEKKKKRERERTDGKDGRNTINRESLDN